MSNVVITGGAGFIGSHLAEKFVAEGFNVIIIDNLFRGKRKNIESLLQKPGNALYEYDLVSPESIEQVKYRNLLAGYCSQRYLLYRCYPNLMRVLTVVFHSLLRVGCNQRYQHQSPHLYLLA